MSNRYQQTLNYLYRIATGKEPSPVMTSIISAPPSDLSALSPLSPMATDTQGTPSGTISVQATSTHTAGEDTSVVISPTGTAQVGIIMGSQSDWATMRPAAALLAEFGIAFDAQVVSAHRTPDKLFDYAKQAKARGLKVIIAGAGGAAHLPGMCASQTPLPVLGVPVKSSILSGWDSLLSIVQMPKGIAVGTLAIGSAGAYNAALMAIQILALQDAELAQRLDAFRLRQTEAVLAYPTPGLTG